MKIRGTYTTFRPPPFVTKPRRTAAWFLRCAHWLNAREREGSVAIPQGLRHTGFRSFCSAPQRGAERSYTQSVACAKARAVQSQSAVRGGVGSGTVRADKRSTPNKIKRVRVGCPRRPRRPCSLVRPFLRKRKNGAPRCASGLIGTAPKCVSRAIGANRAGALVAACAPCPRTPGGAGRRLLTPRRRGRSTPKPKR